MNETRQIMGMPVTIICSDKSIELKVVEKVFDLFRQIDAKYSPFIDSSGVSMINAKKLSKEDYSDELKEIIRLSDNAKKQTHGYFDVWHKGNFDPSGIVKGWAIQKASKLLAKSTEDFYIEAGGDIQVSGKSPTNQPWRVGIRNPFDRKQNISVLSLNNSAVATSGTAIKGQHIYNPFDDNLIEDIISISIVGDDILEVDKFATAAFAMGMKGIEFIESLKGFEGYMVDRHKKATMTSGWNKYEVKS